MTDQYDPNGYTSYGGPPGGRARRLGAASPLGAMVVMGAMATMAAKATASLPHHLNHTKVILRSRTRVVLPSLIRARLRSRIPGQPYPGQPYPGPVSQPSMASRRCSRNLPLRRSHAAA